MSTPLTSSGALKALIEAGGLKVAAYRDAMPDDASLPAITVDENVATSQERHGDTGDAQGHHGESEQLFVHLWELWRKPDGSSGERYDLSRGLKKLLRTAPGFRFGPDNAPTRVYGLTIAGHARIVEEEANVVHHTITLTMRRDA